MTEDDLLTVREVAKLLRVDDTTVRRWIRTKALDAISLPNNNKNRTQFRIRRASIDAIMHRSEENSGQV